MATQTTFSMRMDAKLKERLQAMASNKGMNLSTMTLLMFQHFLKHPQLEVDFRDEWQTEFDFDREQIDQHEFLETLSAMNQS